jgi:hypothetical protein
MKLIGIDQRGQNEATCCSFSASLPLADNVYPAYPDRQNVILFDPLYSSLATSQPGPNPNFLLSQQILLVAANVFPYVLITIFTLTAAPLAKVLPLLFFFFLLHFYALSHILARFYPYIDRESLPGQRKLWEAGNSHLASLAVTLRGVLIGMKTTALMLQGAFWMYVVGCGGMFMGWNACTFLSQSLSLFHVPRIVFCVVLSS